MTLTIKNIEIKSDRFCHVTKSVTLSSTIFVTSLFRKGNFPFPHGNAKNGMNYA